MEDKRFVRVVWHDAADLSDKTWVSPEDVAQFSNELCEVISWGWLVSTSKTYLTLAADYIADTETYGRVTKIPKGMVAKVEEFKQK